MAKAITDTTKESHTDATNATKTEKRRPAFPKVRERWYGLLDPLF